MQSEHLHAVLDQHSHLGWDMDSTLVGGPNSEFFRRYIAEHRNKRHHIITFRFQSWADLIPAELSAAGLDPVTISGIHACPPHLYDLHNEGLLMPSDVTREASYAFLRWKGRVARRLGCTLLVDDLEDWVIHGCKEEGVGFLHSLDGTNLGAREDSRRSQLV
jgi:hypothetical protein